MSRTWAQDKDTEHLGQDGFISVGNSSTTVLGGGASFTGTGEIVAGFASISVFAFSDVASATAGMSLEQSTDGTNWDHTRSLTVELGAGHTHMEAVVARYFRVIYTNGAAAQSSFRLQTIYHTRRSKDQAVGTQDILDSHEDTALVRPASSMDIDINAGRIAHMASVSKFGRNPDVGTGAYEDLWLVGGDYNWLTAAIAVRIKAGGDVNDTAAGTGAQAITVQGLDENWDLAEEDIITAGSSASSATTTTFCRVFRVFNTDVGAYTGVNTGAVTIETTAGVTVASIGAGLGQSLMAIYTVPAGKTAFLTRFDLDVSAVANKTASIRVWQRRDADIVSDPFTGKRLLAVFDEVSGEIIVDHTAWPPLPAKTDFWVSAIGDANATVVDAEFDLLLVDN